jgi:hypothetical protein
MNESVCLRVYEMRNTNDKKNILYIWKDADLAKANKWPLLFVIFPLVTNLSIPQSSRP